MASKKKSKTKGSGKDCNLRMLDLSKSGLSIEDLAKKPWHKQKVRLFFLNKGIVVKSKEELLMLLLMACKAGDPPIGTLNAPFKLGPAPVAA